MTLVVNLSGLIFSEVYLLLLMQSLERLSCHTHTPKCNETAKIRKNYVA